MASNIGETVFNQKTPLERYQAAGDSIMYVMGALRGQSSLLADGIQRRIMTPEAEDAAHQWILDEQNMAAAGQYERRYEGEPRYKAWASIKSGIGITEELAGDLEDRAARLIESLPPIEEPPAVGGA